jgi:polyisoprenoid-binding protein YceI
VAALVLAYASGTYRSLKDIMRPHHNLGLVALSLAWLGAAACDNKPAEGKPQAVVQEVTQPAAPAAPKAPVATTSYAFSQDNSKIEFTGAKITGKHLGAFKTFSGNIRAVAGSTADLTAASVHVEIDVGSITADADKLTEHLKSPDLLDATQYPKASFDSTTVTAQAGSTYNVTGNFKLHGATKQLSFPATIRLAPEQVEADAEFAINRKDFGIVYPGKPDDLIQDEVLIKLTIRAPRAAL